MTGDIKSRKVAKDDVVKFVLKEVMKEKKKVESQIVLTELVNKRLSKADKSYSISPSRLRHIAVSINDIKVNVETRSGNVPEVCPVCEHNLKKRKMKNLKGRKVPYGFTCPKCGFETNNTKIAPRKYEFIFTK